MKSNLNHTETFKYIFFCEVNNKFRDFFGVNFVTAAVLMHLSIRAETLMVS